MCSACDTHETRELASVADRVAAGVQWLREHQGTGFDVARVNPERVDVASVDDCVLAQAYDVEGTSHWSRYGDAMVRATGLDRFDEDAVDWAIGHGFANRGYEDGKALNAEWRRVWPTVLAP
jgi:hypothetical protein